MGPPKTSRRMGAPPPPSAPIRYRSDVSSSQSQQVGRVAVHSSFPSPPELICSVESGHSLPMRGEIWKPIAAWGVAQSPSLESTYDSDELNRADAEPFGFEAYSVKTNCAILHQLIPGDSDGASIVDGAPPHDARRKHLAAPLESGNRHR